MKAKLGPLMAGSGEDAEPDQALSVYTPCTTTIKVGKYEVPLPRVQWISGPDDAVTNVLGTESVEHHRFEREAGHYDPVVLAVSRNRIAWMLELPVSEEP
jgi:hypothetical protein